MRNRHPGTCYFCNKLVEKGQGHFERVPYGWRVIHAECVFKQRELKNQAREADRQKQLDQS